MVMRKISFILSLAIFYIPLSFYGAELEKVEVNSLCYYINKETKTAEVTQGQYDKIKKMLDESNGTLEIPSVINVNEANYTITSVGNSAFAEIYYFCVLNLPETLTSIGDEAFAKNKIDSLSIPDNVTTIGKAAFNDCLNTTSMTIGKGVKAIGAGAFHGMSSLRYVYVLSSEIPETTEYYSDFSNGDWTYVTLYVPSELVNAYRESQFPYWETVKDENIKELENTTSIRRTRTYASQVVYYALDGHRIKTLQKGINIIHQSDGTVRKEIVR